MATEKHGAGDIVMRTQSHKYVDAFNKAFISHDIEHCINVIETVKLQKNGKELSDTLDEIIQIVVERIEINPGNLSQTIKLLPSLHSLKNSNYLLRILHCVCGLLHFIRSSRSVVAGVAPPFPWNSPPLPLPHPLPQQSRAMCPVLPQV